KYNGKKISAYKVVKSAFEIIEKRTKSNPIQVLINAIEHAAPKEETTRLRFGGISVPKAVDTAPQRRLDTSLRNICKGIVNSTHKNKKSVDLCLAEEIIRASKNDPSSFAVAKKNDMERVAKSAR
ncbi:MAG: 30S ribosomal protein S7, partial [Thermoplasmatales archaeon]|nr:30S ribosomal protein S7 [Thermoplasmatales archaeon]